MSLTVAERCARLIDHFIDMLQHPCCIPNLKINKLMINLHREMLDGQVVIMVRDVPSITYGFTPEGDYRCIVLPPTWEETFQANPVLVFGGLVYVAGHANYIHNKKTASIQPEDLRQTGIFAKMYEAEFYRTCDKIGLNYQKTAYQVALLEEYPTLVVDDPIAFKEGDFDFVESFYSKATGSSIE